MTNIATDDMSLNARVLNAQRSNRRFFIRSKLLVTWYGLSSNNVPITRKILESGPTQHELSPHSYN